MQNFKDFGNKIREFRKNKEESLLRVSSSLGIDKTYLSKLENGHLKPSKKILERISNYYSLSEEKMIILYDFAGYGEEEKQFRQNEDEREVIKMDESPSSVITKGKEGAVEIGVPNNVQVLYSNAVFITSDDFGVVLDFAQRLGSTSNHNVVSRIGMSFDHAENFLKVLKENIDVHKLKIAKKAIA
ncbi:MAG: DUF3467 domain-containing protein [Candidatus Daviesbacteria bacterium]|nr:DUF3467 domain-containing protein [Candidatus Daviesbacteria bacterium]